MIKEISEDMRIKAWNLDAISAALLLSKESAMSAKSYIDDFYKVLYADTFNEDMLNYCLKDLECKINDLSFHARNAKERLVALKKGKPCFD
jgi:hypothetical protein